MNEEVVRFTRQKDYKYIDDIGRGGTAKTVLLWDENINQLFVCKKYEPIQEQYRDMYFDNFKNEIKIMYNLFHPNIIRIFTYYLYPEQKTGYILMEHIKGCNITNFIEKNTHLIKNIFEQTIEGFIYLERNNILHRDIRSNNILVSENGVVKIIDFGFGKIIDFDQDSLKSISINWAYEEPEDFLQKKYNVKTEIYFVGKLFESIIKTNNITNFEYIDTIRKMTEKDPNKRIESFSLILFDKSLENKRNIEFSETEINSYTNFASELCMIIAQIGNESEYNRDIDNIIKSLNDIYINSILEDNIYNQSSLISSIIKGKFRYYKKNYADKIKLKCFIELLTNSTEEKRVLIMNNLWGRLDAIERYVDNLPF